MGRLGADWGGLWAILERVGGVLRAGSNEILTFWSVVGSLLEAVCGFLLILKLFSIDFLLFRRGFGVRKGTIQVRFYLDFESFLIIS